jgi:hypothetical protein
MGRPVGGPPLLVFTASNRRFDSYSLLQPYGLMRHVFGRMTSVANGG